MSKSDADGAPMKDWIEKNIPTPRGPFGFAKAAYERLPLGVVIQQPRAHRHFSGEIALSQNAFYSPRKVVDRDVDGNMIERDETAADVAMRRSFADVPRVRQLLEIAEAAKPPDWRQKINEANYLLELTLTDGWKVLFVYDDYGDLSHIAWWLDPSGKKIEFDPKSPERAIIDAWRGVRSLERMSTSLAAAEKIRREREGIMTGSLRLLPDLRDPRIRSWEPTLRLVMEVSLAAGAWELPPGKTIDDVIGETTWEIIYPKDVIHLASFKDMLRAQARADDAV